MNCTRKCDGLIQILYFRQGEKQIVLVFCVILYALSTSSFNLILYLTYILYSSNINSKYSLADRRLGTTVSPFEFLLYYYCPPHGSAEYQSCRWNYSSAAARNHARRPATLTVACTYALHSMTLDTCHFRLLGSPETRTFKCFNLCC